MTYIISHRAVKYEDLIKVYREHGFNKSPLLEPVDVIQSRMYAWSFLLPNEFLIDYDTTNEWFRVGKYDQSIHGKVPNITWKDKVKKFINEHL